MCELVRGLGDDVLTSYEKLLKRHYKDKENHGIDQNRALQAVFDFKFLSTVFGERSKVEVSLELRRCPWKSILKTMLALRKEEDTEGGREGQTKGKQKGREGRREAGK